MDPTDEESWDCRQDWHKIYWPGEKPSEKTHPTHATMVKDVTQK